MNYAESCNITGNTISQLNCSSGFYGIRVYSGSGMNTISGNTIVDNYAEGQHRGLYLCYSDYNNVTDNTISNGSSDDNCYGMLVSYSDDNPNIDNNTISNLSSDKKTKQQKDTQPGYGDL